MLGSAIQEQKKVWIYGVNDAFEEPSAEALKVVKEEFAGFLRADFLKLCQFAAVVPHPAFALSAQGDSSAESAVFSVQSALLDRAAYQLLKHVIPTSLHLEVLKFTGCHLDTEMLGLLRAGLIDTCTVVTLHVDWNVVEVPIDLPAVTKLLAEGSIAGLDELESKRDIQQIDRELHFLKELLETKFNDVETAISSLGAVADSEYPATAVLMPLDAVAWSLAMEQVLGLPTIDGEKLFHLLDSRGGGDGLLTLHYLQETLNTLPQLEAVTTDPIGTAFAGFVDGHGVLENVSFRCCNIGRPEVQTISTAMHDAKHLRALNLWGNRITDVSTAPIANALEVYFGLEYLGLGKNYITESGLKALCKAVGATRIDSKDETDQIYKNIKDQTKDRDKKLKQLPARKKDGNGRERYTTELRTDSCEEHKDPETGELFWIFFRNGSLRTLNLEGNPIQDARTVLELQPFGVGGDLVLRGTRCVAQLKTASQVPGFRSEEENQESVVTGWNLILH